MSTQKSLNQETVVASNWRALPDAYDPPDIEILRQQAERQDCVLIATVTPEQDGFRHVLTMVPRPEKTG